MVSGTVIYLGWQSLRPDSTASHPFAGPLYPQSPTSYVSQSMFRIPVFHAIIPSPTPPPPSFSLFRLLSPAIHADSISPHLPPTNPNPLTVFLPLFPAIQADSAFSASTMSGSLTGIPSPYFSRIC